MGPPGPATPLTTSRHYRHVDTSLHEQSFTAAAVLDRRGSTEARPRSLQHRGFSACLAHAPFLSRAFPRTSWRPALCMHGTCSPLLTRMPGLTCLPRVVSSHILLSPRTFDLPHAYIYLPPHKYYRASVTQTLPRPLEDHRNAGASSPLSLRSQCTLVNFPTQAGTPSHASPPLT
jgi:hypothetical protein